MRIFAGLSGQYNRDVLAWLRYYRVVCFQAKGHDRFAGKHYRKDMISML